ncbi:MAG: hypothetical protein OEW42_03855 [Acidimicrobiia bacterium]|nr:hypothetical protein [Acidimicrobiia bacterium]MDH5238650.1 hypothetical protein [Acidimicrobiia bacterium]
MPRADDHDRPPLGLVVEFCRALGEAGVDYCHWKSNEAIALSANGVNDLDLLVARSHSRVFEAVAARMGFRRARPSADRLVPGLLDSYGRDPETGLLVHLQAHYQLVLGDDMTKSFHLPIEEAYLASCFQHDVFRLPAPELELMMLVLRLTLKHNTWDAMACAQGALAPSERRELDHLRALVDDRQLATAVDQTIPFIGAELVDRCLGALAPDAPWGERIAAAAALEAAMAGHHRLSPVVDVPTKVARRFRRGASRYLLGRRARKRIDEGGLLIAVVGSDGSGKSSAIDHLATMLTPFPVRHFHLGKPRRPLPSQMARLVLRAGRVAKVFPSFTAPPEDPSAPPHWTYLLWHAINASDRRREYRRARRFASNGGFALCDRFPLPGLIRTDGPRIEWQTAGRPMSAFGRLMARVEKRRYADVCPPDLLIVLTVDPDRAVRRRPEQDADFVRPRAEEILAATWPASAAVIDANADHDKVLDEVAAVVWERL